MKINKDSEFWSDGYLEVLWNSDALSVFKGENEICRLETNDRNLVRHVLKYYDVCNTAVKTKNKQGDIGIIVFHKGNKYTLWVATCGLWLICESTKVSLRDLNKCLLLNGFPEWRPKNVSETEKSIETDG